MTKQSKKTVQKGMIWCQASLRKNVTDLSKSTEANLDRPDQQQEMRKQSKKSVQDDMILCQASLTRMSWIYQSQQKLIRTDLTRNKK